MKQTDFIKLLTSLDLNFVRTLLKALGDCVYKELNNIYYKVLVIFRHFNAEVIQIIIDFLTKLTIKYQIHILMLCSVYIYII